jgi:undecaprenyl-diphosphatase
MLEYLIELDKQLFLFLNSLHSPFWDTVMWHISGKYQWVPFYAFILYMIIRKYKMRTFYVIVFVTLLITMADQSSVKLFKFVFERPRPCHDDALQGLVHIVNGKCGGPYGFVSSHASNVFALAMFTALIIRKRWFIYLMFFFASIVSYSRIYLGVHYPGDIIGGAILGVICGLITFYLMVLFERYVIDRKEGRAFSKD